MMNRMKVSYGTIRIVIAALILALTGCAMTRVMTTRFEKPTFTLQGTEQVEASQGKVVVTFLFIAHNPNKAGLRNVTCSYELSVEGVRFMTGKDIPLTLDPKGDTEISVPATISYEDLAPVLGSVLRRILSGKKTLPVTIVAVFSGKPAIYGEPGKETPLDFEWRVLKNIEIPFPQEKKSREE